MKKEPVYPTTIPGRDVYFKNAVARVVSEATQLGIDPDVITDMQSAFGPDSLAGTYLNAKKNYDLAPGKKKPGDVSLALKKASDLMEKKLTAIYDDIGASKWNDDDRRIFNRKDGLPREIHHSHTPIADKCTLDIEMHPNGLVICKVRTGTDTKKHNLPDGADAVEFCYAVVEGKFKAGGELAGKVKVTCNGPGDGTTSVLFFKAIFEVQIDATLSGFDLHCWVRWTNTRHPELAGEWSEVHINMIR